MDLLSQNPCQVTEVSSSEYSSEDKDRLREEGGLALYWNLSRKSWDCVLQCPDTPAVALRLFQAPSEEDAQNWFLKLCPLLELARPQFNTKTLQTITDCLKNHPDWSWAHIAVETGISGLNCQDGTRQTALHLACEKGDLDCVQELLQEYGASTEVRNHNGDTPFHCAAKQDSAAIIQELCSRSCAGVNELNDDGETPLHVACQFGKVQSLKALLESGAKCDVIRGKADAGMKYSMRSSAETIQEGDPAQPQREDEYAGCAPYEAVTSLMPEILPAKANSRIIQRETGECGLHMSIKGGFFDAVIELLLHGADINLRGLDGNTALHYAMKMDDMEMVKALIVFGADVEIPNDLGETLELIAEQTSERCVVYCLGMSMLIVFMNVCKMMGMVAA
ncbi:hypothetical protein GJAV_G00143050 [Gymnothorax javanicus]|nr:hypothetical protein GJAV_G00143050 [Gymnothorax javanicus]